MAKIFSPEDIGDYDAPHIQNFSEDELDAIGMNPDVTGSRESISSLMTRQRVADGEYDVDEALQLAMENGTDAFVTEIDLNEADIEVEE